MLIGLSITFYWLVCGMSLLMLPNRSELDPIAELVVCLLCGGIVVPARLVGKLIS